MFSTIAFPIIDPVAIQIGPLAIRWYVLAYVAGIVFGWGYAHALVAGDRGPLTPSALDDFLTWAILGIVLGGRIGYVAFYNPDYYLRQPLQILEIWRGGMSFHGGLVGVIVAMALFARRKALPFLQLSDPIAAAAPIGLFLGRLANFIDGELFGWPSSAPWAMVFPDGGPLPRHPSQLYEAGLEGLALFIVLAIAAWGNRATRRPGLLSGLFLCGYALSRMAAEIFREPDPQSGLLFGGATMGQLLSLPVFVAGILLVRRARRQQSPAASMPG